jgi:phage shock protein PspC (stress-responsive transcriptional regulator)
MTTPTPTPSSGPKRLVRSTDDRWLSGVCGGLARYFGVDANLVRLIVVVAALVSCGTAVIAYLAAWVLMPEE